MKYELKPAILILDTINDFREKQSIKWVSYMQSKFLIFGINTIFPNESDGKLV